VRTPVVRVEGARALTNSRDVAAYFEKRHADIMRDIRALIDAEPDLGERNFALTSYLDESNRQSPCYDMDRDGFALLAMGFTGSKALQFKLTYIRTFDAMEAELANRSTVRDPAKRALIEALQNLDRVEQHQIIQDDRIHRIEARQSAIENGCDFFEVKGFARYHNIPIDLPTAISLGTRAAKLSRQLGIRIGAVPNASHGTHNTYHTSILEEVFEELL
jgi:Rha family phage regulatory protein